MPTATWKDILVDQVVLQCERHNVTEVECEPMIQQLLKDINEENRPTISEVMMACKRRIWGLAPFPF